MKIVIAHFTNWWVGMSGGVEKVVCQFANAMCGRGHEVTILYIGDKEGSPYYFLDDRIRQVNILFEDGKQVVTRRLPVAERVHREIGRLFSQKKHKKSILITGDACMAQEFENGWNRMRRMW